MVKIGAPPTVWCDARANASERGIFSKQFVKRSVNVYQYSPSFGLPEINEGKQKQLTDAAKRLNNQEKRITIALKIGG